MPSASTATPLAKFAASALFCALLAGCGAGHFYGGFDVASAQFGTPKPSTPATMRPYTIAGKRYYPAPAHLGDVQTGIASWYGPGFHGKLTSNGERFNTHTFTAAHKTMPMNTIVRVDNLENGRSVTVRINDRGPFVAGRIIDLSNAAAHAILMTKKGTARVRLTVVGVEKKGASAGQIKASAAIGAAVGGAFAGGGAGGQSTGGAGGGAGGGGGGAGGTGGVGKSAAKAQPAGKSGKSSTAQKQQKLSLQKPAGKPAASAFSAAAASAGVASASEKSLGFTGHIVQLGAFTEAANAKKYAAEQTRPAKILRGSDGFYRVYVGDFATAEQAAAFARKSRVSGAIVKAVK